MIRKMTDSLLGVRDNSIVSVNVVTKKETNILTLPLSSMSIIMLQVSFGNRYLCITLELKHGPRCFLLMDMYDHTRRRLLYGKMSPFQFRGNCLLMRAPVNNGDNLCCYDLNRLDWTYVVNPLGYVRTVTCDGVYTYLDRAKNYTVASHFPATSRRGLTHGSQILSYTHSSLHTLTKLINDNPLSHIYNVIDGFIVVIVDGALMSLYDSRTGARLFHTLGDRIGFRGELLNGYLISSTKKNSFFLLDKTLKNWVPLAPVRDIIPLTPTPIYFLILELHIIPELLTEIDRYLRGDC